MFEKIQQLKAMLSKFDWQNSILFATDSYKYSHFAQYPKDTDYIYSYIEARKESDYSDVVVFAGIQGAVNKYLTHPVTAFEVEAAALFAELHGVPFNYDGWMEIVNKFNGYLPIAIEAVPEGTVVPVKNVLATVCNTVKGFGWVVGWCEPVLLRAAWYKSTVATYSAVMKKEIISGYRKSGVPENDIRQLISFAHHDFGSRGVSSGESAGTGGSGHAMSSMGSDTIEGVIHTIMNFEVSSMPCYSVPAAEHSTVTIYLRDNELEAIKNMINTFGDKYKIISFVADSYDLMKNIEMVVSLKDLIVEKGVKFVIRPDSGDPKESILKVFRNLYSMNGLVSNRATNKWELPDWLGVLQGDGICIETVRAIVDALTSVSFSTKGLVFGQGGKLLQDHTRDDFGWAMKCSFAIVDGNDRDVYKDPITDSNKKSKKGKMKLIRPNGKYMTILSSEDKQYSIYHTELKLMYSCDERKIPVHIVQNWNDIRQRVDEFIFS